MDTHKDRHFAERRIAVDETATRSLAVEAGRRALKAAGLSDDIDLVIVGTVTPIWSFPLPPAAFKGSLA